ncbi:MAG: hypothetical protein A2Y78_02140 [Acidobacteria bacterium RBG_13_68_16]|jgi:hypothetical protein|nr:MAG: hypothetical protein A2Y78_02140 [Acidobacteria bacterium RBG_13_68_16]
MASAQGRSPFEIAPFIGYRFGGSVGDTFSTARYGIDGARSEGVTISVPVYSRRAVELLFSRQDTGVEVAGFPGTTRHNLTIEHWMVGAVGEFPGESGRVRPFVAGYLGLTKIRSGNGSTTSNGYGSAALGGGIKLDLARHVGVRFDARAYAIFARRGAGAICGPAGCSVAFTGNAMFQGEVAASLVLKL